MAKRQSKKTKQDANDLLAGEQSRVPEETSRDNAAAPDESATEKPSCSDDNSAAAAGDAELEQPEKCGDLTGNPAPPWPRELTIRIPIGAEVENYQKAPNYTLRPQTHLDIQLYEGPQERAYARLFFALDKLGARLNNGRRVATRVDAVRWLIDQIANGIVAAEAEIAANPEGNDDQLQKSA